MEYRSPSDLGLESLPDSVRVDIRCGVVTGLRPVRNRSLCGNKIGFALDGVRRLSLSDNHTDRMRVRFMIFKLEGALEDYENYEQRVLMEKIVLTWYHKFGLSYNEVSDALWRLGYRMTAKQVLWVVKQSEVPPPEKF